MSTAILIGSVIISLGIFFGLRSGKNDASPAPLSPAVVPPGLEPARAAAPPPVDKQRVARDAAAALMKHKKALTGRCVAAALAKQPSPPTVKWLFNVTFDATGKMIARGVFEDRETSRPEVTKCVNESFPDLVVPAPGQTVLVDVPLELP